MAAHTRSQRVNFISDKKRFFNQVLIFAGMYIGYVTCILLRASFTFVMPITIAEDGLKNSDLGAITSSLLLGYTVSKFTIGAAFADRFSSKWMFCVGLLISAIITLLFTSTLSVWLLCVLWFCNGAAQGGSWISCAKIMKKWYPANTFGTLWAVLSTAMNTARAIGPPMAAYVALTFGWRSFFYIIGAFSIGLVLVLFVILKDSPEEAGFQELANSQGDGAPSKNTKKVTTKSKEELSLTFGDLLRLPFLWIMCSVGIVVLAARFSIYEWGQLYLIQEKHHSNYRASTYLVFEQIGGLVGAIAGGFIADRTITQKSLGSTKNPRLKVMHGFGVLALAFMYLFIYHIDENSSQWWIYLIGFVMGFCYYGTIAIFGVVAIEIAPDHLCAKSSAICDAAMNVGQALAGLPLTYIATISDWTSAFILLEVSLAVVLAISVFIGTSLDHKLHPKIKTA